MKNKTDTITLVILLIIVCTISYALTWAVRVARAEPIDTYHSGWNLVRETADEDGTTFAAVYDLTGVGTTNGNFASKDTSTVLTGGAFHIPTLAERQGVGYSRGSKWVFAICGKCYNDVDDTFSFNVVGWSKDNGMLHNICEGDGVLGTQAVVVYPDADDAHGALISETAVVYTHGTTTFTVTNEGFDGAVVGMLARVTGTDLTNEIVQITTVTDVNIIICSGVTSADNNTDSTVQVNPAFWTDTINLDELTKWSAAGAADPNSNMMANNVAILNSGDNEVALLVIDLAGLEYIQFVFYDCDAATGDEAGDLTVYGRPY